MQSQYMATFKKEADAQEWVRGAAEQTGADYEILPFIRPGTKRPIFQVWKNTEV